MGVHEPDDVVRLLYDLGCKRAAALVVRSPFTATVKIRRAADESGVALLGLARKASWAQVAAMLRTLLVEGDIGDISPQTLGGMLTGDLFALANAVAALLDAPVTIEDRSSRVLAFSGRQDERPTSPAWRRSWAAGYRRASPSAWRATASSSDSIAAMRPFTSIRSTTRR
ncbi:hypothetical protein ACVWZD_008828 [Streptomyces sp. TE3672]